MARNVAVYSCKRKTHSSLHICDMQKYTVVSYTLRLKEELARVIANYLEFR
ncbi:hypothetical protein MTR_1g037020 [Medicago truncatula]|uniref:Uncharacterized protein n=1 Tax=Medicago truncatula TaxID=3880 RepID=A0A072VHL9_MEDTR|nr:hypothetical protein MTR_1g037020 [Medicago truncatula]